jgi:hypothetical protein
LVALLSANQRHPDFILDRTIEDAKVANPKFKGCKLRGPPQGEAVAAWDSGIVLCKRGTHRIFQPGSLGGFEPPELPHRIRRE